MSQPLYPKPRLFGSRRTIAIVTSAYNPEFVQGLVDHAAREIETQASTTGVLLKQVPGAFEIPLMVKLIIQNHPVVAVIALGVILRGETGHADLIARSVTDSLQAIALETGVPVIHEVLLLDNEEQARERCLGEEINRGTEAGRAALEMAGVISRLKSKTRP